MWTMFTNETSMVQHYDLAGAVATLENSGVILFPTDTLWSIGCDVSDPVALKRLLRFRPSASLEILVNSVDMLKEYVAHVHPRIETLLVYHVRPLTILFDKVRQLPVDVLVNGRSAAFRVVQDEYCRDLIGALGRPIASIYAWREGSTLPSHFGAVSSDVIEAVDYVTKFRQGEKAHGEPSVMVRLTRKDEFEFLRE